MRSEEAQTIRRRDVEIIQIIPEYADNLAGGGEDCQCCERRCPKGSCQAYGKICRASEISVPEHAKWSFKRPQRHNRNLLHMTRKCGIYSWGWQTLPAPSQPETQIYMVYMVSLVPCEGPFTEVENGDGSFSLCLSGSGLGQVTCKVLHFICQCELSGTFCVPAGRQLLCHRSRISLRATERTEKAQGSWHASCSSWLSKQLMGLAFLKKQCWNFWELTHTVAQESA